MKHLLRPKSQIMLITMAMITYLVVLLHLDKKGADNNIRGTLFGEKIAILSEENDGKALKSHLLFGAIHPQLVRGGVFWCLL